jgi:hypothetical protein
MRSWTNVSLYKIAHRNLLRSEFCLPLSIGPLRDHAIIVSATVCTKNCLLEGQPVP